MTIKKVDCGGQEVEIVLCDLLSIATAMEGPEGPVKYIALKVQPIGEEKFVILAFDIPDFRSILRIGEEIKKIEPGIFDSPEDN
jgi:hypothetical protein